MGINFLTLLNNYLIKDLVKVNRGSSPRPIIEYLSDSGYRWLKISDFKMYDRFVYDTKEHIKESGLNDLLGRLDSHLMKHIALLNLALKKEE